MKVSIGNGKNIAEILTDLFTCPFLLMVLTIQIVYYIMNGIFSNVSLLFYVAAWVMTIRSVRRELKELKGKILANNAMFYWQVNQEVAYSVIVFLTAGAIELFLMFVIAPKTVLMMSLFFYFTTLCVYGYEDIINNKERANRKV